ncbi:unnamed protein product, partial [Leptidea sinapis]
MFKDSFVPAALHPGVPLALRAVEGLLLRAGEYFAGDAVLLAAVEGLREELHVGSEAGQMILRKIGYLGHMVRHVRYQLLGLVGRVEGKRRACIGELGPRCAMDTIRRAYRILFYDRAGGLTSFPAMLNNTVHVIMYSYYLLSAEGSPTVKAFLIRYKKWLTILQMIFLDINVSKLKINKTIFYITKIGNCVLFLNNFILLCKRFIAIVVR